MRILYAYDIVLIALIKCLQTHLDELHNGPQDTTSTMYVPKLIERFDVLGHCTINDKI